LGLAVGAKLTDADKFPYLTEFYSPPESNAWPCTFELCTPMVKNNNHATACKGCPTISII